MLFQLVAHPYAVTLSEIGFDVVIHFGGKVFLFSMKRHECTCLEKIDKIAENVPSAHQPSTRLKAAPTAWLLIPQLRQDSWGALPHDVRINADHTVWLT
jgi:hypothetical protein